MFNFYLLKERRTDNGGVRTPHPFFPFLFLLIYLRVALFHRRSCTDVYGTPRNPPPTITETMVSNTDSILQYAPNRCCTTRARDIVQVHVSRARRRVRLRGVLLNSEEEEWLDCRRAKHPGTSAAACGGCESGAIDQRSIHADRCARVSNIGPEVIILPRTAVNTVIKVELGDKMFTGTGPHEKGSAV